MDAYLTVNSLALLGFNTDNYPFLYEGLAYTIKPLTINTFQTENETILLCTLHFLLIRLDSVKFDEEIKNCWPFLDIKGKNNYKRAIHSCLERVSIKYKQPCDLSTAYWSLHNCAKSEEIWTLLRSLSDLCLNVTITELLSDDENIVSANSKEEITNSKEIDDKAGWIHVDLSSTKEEFVSVHDTILHTKSQELLMDTMIQLQNAIKDEILMKIAKQHRQRTYMEELDVRYKKAKTLLDTTYPHLKQQQPSISNNNTNYPLSISKSSSKNNLLNSTIILSQQKNIEKINKLKNSLNLLKDLVNSILLETGIEHITMEKEHLHHYSNMLNEMKEYFNQEITLLSLTHTHQTIVNSSMSNNNNNNNNSISNTTSNNSDNDNVFNSNYATKYQAGAIELQATHSTISDDVDHLLTSLEILSTKLTLTQHRSSTF